MRSKLVIGLGMLLVLAARDWTGQLSAQGKDKDGWITLFNGKDKAGWKLKSDKYTITKFVDEKGQVIPGAKETKIDQVLTVVDAKGKPIAGAKVNKQNGKDVAVDAEGKAIANAKVAKTGGRLAIVDAKSKELTTAKKVQETVANPTGGWKVENGVLTCGLGPKGVDLYTEQKFQDFDLHVEFLGTSNSGVYLQGRYEIQIDNSFKVKPKLVEKDGKQVEVLPNTMCGALYGQIPPSKNMAKPPTEWQTFDIRFRAPRGEKGKVKQKARVTVVWNGTKVIDNAEIPNGTALDPGPILLQGDHGKVSFRNIKIKPLSSAEVNGKVLLDGKPLSGGSITFVSVEGNSTTASITVDGQYSVQVPVGVAKVSISLSKVVGKKKLGNPKSPEVPIVKELLPPQFNTQTMLRFEVVPGKNQANFDLKSN